MDQYFELEEIPDSERFHYHEVEGKGRLMVSTCTTEEGAGGEALRRRRCS